MCSLSVSSDIASGFKRIVTNARNQNLSVLLTATSVLIYDISEAAAKDQVSINEDEKSKQRFNPVLTVKLNPSTYDYILDFNLDPDDYMNSWITLINKEFQLLQLLRLKELVEFNQRYLRQSLVQNNVLSVNFAEPQEEVRILIDIPE